jgi:hypothetical protein
MEDCFDAVDDLAVLAAPDTSYVGGNAGVDDDVFFVGVAIDLQTS